MGYKYYNRDEKRLQRKLIPLNLFVAILSLVAAISLLVTPLVTIDLGQAMTAVAEMAGDMAGDVSGDDEAGAEASEIMSLFTEGLELKISVKPLGMARIAFADDDKKAETLIDEFVIQSGLVENIMVTTINMMMVGMMELEDNATVSYSELNSALRAVDSAQNKEQFQTAVNNYISKIETATGELDEDLKADVNDAFLEAYDKTVEKVGSGNFSLEAMVCVLASDMMTEEGVDVNFTSYSELFFGLIDGTISMPGSDGENNAMEGMGEIMQIFNDYAGYYGYMFYAILFFVAMWAILFLFSFFHTFAKNKRFTMWYVKLFGCYPCLLFGVFPLVGKLLVSNLMGETGKAIAPILGCVSTMTWISGVCYLLLWFVSVFWAFPIKRKIRKLRG